MKTFLKSEWPLLAGLATTALFLAFAGWLADLASPAWFGFVSSWLFAAILVASFAAVRHAEAIAARLGEPLGTLVLTLAVTGIEVTIIAAVMYAGQGNSALARDAMFAVVMIVLNGMIGLSLLLGGLRFREQTYNLQGANAFLAVIVPIAVLGLVLPNFTSSPGPSYSPLHASFFIVMSIVLYGVFLAIQNVRHREYFIDSAAAGAAPGHGEARSLAWHAPLLALYLVAVVLLAKQLALPINYGIHVMQAPAALGGFLVSVLVLAPESLSAARAALANQLQRSVNLLLGSVLASISLTIPAVLAIGFITDQTIVLGLDAADTTLLVLTLAVSTLTFASSRTNVLLGVVHLLLFLAYLMLIFEK
ncbi:MAG: calcium:proton antiporter [Burkholderiales bacterium]